MRKFHCDITLIGIFLTVILVPNSCGIYAYTPEHEQNFRDKLEYVLGDSNIHDEKESPTNDEIHGRFSDILSDVLMTEKAPSVNSELNISKSAPELNGYCNDSVWYIDCRPISGFCCYAEEGDEPGSYKYNDSFPGADCFYGPYIPRFSRRSAGSITNKLLSKKDAKKVSKLESQIPYHEGRWNIEDPGECPSWGYTCPGDGSNFCGRPNPNPDNSTGPDDSDLFPGCEEYLKPFRGPCCYAEKCANRRYRMWDGPGFNCDYGWSWGTEGGYCPSWAYECPGNGSNFCGFEPTSPPTSAPTNPPTNPPTNIPTNSPTSAAKPNHHQSIATNLVLFLASMALNIGIKKS